MKPDPSLINRLLLTALWTLVALSLGYEFCWAIERFGFNTVGYVIFGTAGLAILLTIIFGLITDIYDGDGGLP